jgi:hypothetical protein
METAMTKHMTPATSTTSAPTTSAARRGLMAALAIAGISLAAVPASAAVVVYGAPIYAYPPPVYYAPRPVYVAPAPVYVTPVPAPAPIPAPVYVKPVASGTCQPYTTTVTVDGKKHQVSGTACRQPDGSWRVVG